VWSTWHHTVQITLSWCLATHYPIFSIFKSLGCPNGCGDGMSGSYGDHLRAKGQNCLQRLQRINPVLFRHDVINSNTMYMLIASLFKEPLHHDIASCLETPINQSDN
jgi:hypothetical protein